jgi:aminopeptidase N
VKLNPNQTGVYRVRYSSELLAKLQPGVKTLNTSDRIGLVGDAFALATAGLTPVVDVLQFLLGFVDETDYTVWSSIASGLGAIKQILASDADAYAALKRFTRKLFAKVAAEVGWVKSSADEAHTQSLKRALVLKAMAGAGDEATISEAMQKWEVLKADPSSDGE